MLTMLFLVIGFGAGFVPMLIIYRSAKSESRRYESELRVKISENTELIRNAAQAEAKITALEEKLETQAAETDRMQKRLTTEFENIANRIFDDKSRKFTDINRDNISNILRPLGENIENFRKKVEDAYKTESNERFSLKNEVEKLVKLNQHIGEEAANLTNALKGNSKVQGDWGEMILENILEKSGLTKGDHYFVQEALRDENDNALLSETGRRMIPDVVVNCPDSRKIIIDSKVSLKAYVEYANADDAAIIAHAAAEHLASVRRHIDELGRKNYQEHARSLDFVMMFVPNEPAYSLALRTDNDLWHYAYNKGVLLISPTHLITSLRLISDLWKRDDQNRNAREIAERGAQLYDKFAGFVESMNEIDRHLIKTRKSYDSAMSQLSEGKGNLIGQVDKLRDLGVKAKKSLAIKDSGEDA